uniref:Uncharacterized protein n=1 Tax=Oryza glaberrima TaxID=4538 RepID=I1QDX5_ORYGL
MALTSRTYNLINSAWWIGKFQGEVFDASPSRARKKGRCAVRRSSALSIHGVPQPCGQLLWVLGFRRAARLGGQGRRPAGGARAARVQPAARLIVSLFLESDVEINLRNYRAQGRVTPWEGEKRRRGLGRRTAAAQEDMWGEGDDLWGRM